MSLDSRGIALVEVAALLVALTVLTAGVFSVSELIAFRSRIVARADDVVSAVHVDAARDVSRGIGIHSSLVEAATQLEREITDALGDASTTSDYFISVQLRLLEIDPMTGGEVGIIETPIHVDRGSNALRDGRLIEETFARSLIGVSPHPYALPQSLRAGSEAPFARHTSLVAVFAIVKLPPGPMTHIARHAGMEVISVGRLAAIPGGVG